MGNNQNSNVEFSITENNTVYPVLFESCDRFMGEIATQVWATSKWVFNRNATLEINKDTELSEYLDTIDELQQKYKDWKTKDVLKDINEALAHLFWYFNQKPENQTKEEQDDDYYDAKRYLGFLLADMILSQCSKEDKCPDEFLMPEYIGYLRCVSIEEFVKHKAYLKWHDRNKDKHIKDSDREISDYFDMVGFLDKTMINCKRKECAQNIEAWSALVDKVDYKQDTTILDAITKAKTNALRRFADKDDVQVEIENAERFVHRFYPQVFGWIIKSKSPDRDKAKEIVDSIYGNSKVTNMFEFILKCSLLCHLNTEEHIQLRTKHNKGSALNKREDTYLNVA